MFCKFCGKEINENSKHCQHCGKLNTARQAAPEIDTRRFATKEFTIGVAVLILVAGCGLYWYAEEGNSGWVLHLF